MLWAHDRHGVHDLDVATDTFKKKFPKKRAGVSGKCRELIIDSIYQHTNCTTVYHGARATNIHTRLHKRGGTILAKS